MFLKRTVDLESRNQYLQLLADKSITKESLVKGILASPEFHGLYIDAAYSDYLGRAAEPGTGKDASLTSFAGGMTIDQFNIGMLASDEYFGLHGSKNYA